MKLIVTVGFLSKEFFALSFMCNIVVLFFLFPYFTELLVVGQPNFFMVSVQEIILHF